MNMDEIVTLEELASRVRDAVRLGVGGARLSRLAHCPIKQVLDLGSNDFIFAI